MGNRNYRIGVDIGGTFTDTVMVDTDSGVISTAKVPTTPQDPSKAFLTSVQRVLQGASPSEVLQIIHATTIATNAILEGKVAKTAFVTTLGFRDILEIQRQIRPRLYDLFFDKPVPLVPRWLSFEITERITPEGEVLVPLNEQEIPLLAEKLKEEGVESVAVCFLHSYVNPKHEKIVAEGISRLLPQVNVSASYEISPQFREYLRASTTVINAALVPIMAKYLEKLEADLRAKEFRGEVYIMQSSGGLIRSDVARYRPCYMVESGPAAGVIAAAYASKLLGLPNVLSFDMGGTTAKAGLIENGTPTITFNYEVGAVATAEIAGLTKGSGYPLRTPVIDLVEVGAGGGSVAWIDSGGALRVGPQSSGAVPGPVSYMKGGILPTVTDANLVLGRLNPEYFLGGEMKLDRAAAERAIKERCADGLGKDVVTTANAIIEIANSNMLSAMRLTSVERGYDPRNFAVIVFGGAGPLHVNALARDLQIGTVIVPPSPGLFSAVGLLVSDLKHDYFKTYVKELTKVDYEDVESEYLEFESQAMNTLRDEGVPKPNMTLSRSMDLRYVGQSYELPIPIPNAKLTPSSMTSIREAFHSAHERAYGHAAKGEPVEVVNLKLTAMGLVGKPVWREIAKGEEADATGALKNKRKVFFSESNEFVSCSVYDRYKLKRGNRVNGPAVIEETDSTILVHPGYAASVDRYGFVSITRENKAIPVSSG